MLQSCNNRMLRSGKRDLSQRGRVAGVRKLKDFQILEIDEILLAYAQGLKKIRFFLRLAIYGCIGRKHVYSLPVRFRWFCLRGPVWRVPWLVVERGWRGFEARPYPKMWGLVTDRAQKFSIFAILRVGQQYRNKNRTAAVTPCSILSA